MYFKERLNTLSNLSAKIEAEKEALTQIVSGFEKLEKIHSVVLPKEAIKNIETKTWTRKNRQKKTVLNEVKDQILGVIKSSNGIDRNRLRVMFCSPGNPSAISTITLHRYLCKAIEDNQVRVDGFKGTTKNWILK